MVQVGVAFFLIQYLELVKLRTIPGVVVGQTLGQRQTVLARQVIRQRAVVLFRHSMTGTFQQNNSLCRNAPGTPRYRTQVAMDLSDDPRSSWRCPNQPALPLARARATGMRMQTNVRT